MMAQLYPSFKKGEKRRTSDPEVPSMEGQAQIARSRPRPRSDHLSYGMLCGFLICAVIVIGAVMLTMASPAAEAAQRSPMWNVHQTTCANYDKKLLYSQADADFSTYAVQAKVNPKLLEKQYAQLRTFCATRKCLHVIIVRGRVIARLGNQGSYESRWKSVAFQIFTTSSRFYPLPDAEFFVDLTDGSFVDSFDNEGVDPRAPLFVVTRHRSSMVAQQGNGILYPDFTFFQWPESKCLGEESHSYTHILDVIAEESRKANTNGTWWEKKKDVMFWRGARLGGRRFVIEGSKLNHSRGVDIQFMFPGAPKTCVSLLSIASTSIFHIFQGKLILLGSNTICCVAVACSVLRFSGKSGGPACSNPGKIMSKLARTGQKPPQYFLRFVRAQMGVERLQSRGSKQLLICLARMLSIVIGIT